MSFYDNYEKCCREKGILPKSQYAADMLGCTKSSISAFAKSGKAPSGIIVANASKMLDVSSDYLLEIIDEPRPICIQKMGLAFMQQKNFRYNIFNFI